MKAVLIRWHDAHADVTSWTHMSEVEDDGPYVVESVGWLLQPGQGGKRNHLSLAQSRGQDENIDSVLHIPQRMVVEVTVLFEDGKNGKGNVDRKRGTNGAFISTKSDAKGAGRGERTTPAASSSEPQSTKSE